MTTRNTNKPSRYYVFATNTHSQLVSLGHKVWELRKYVYNNSSKHMWDLSKINQKHLKNLRNLTYRTALSDANSIEYNFGAGLTELAIDCFVCVENIEGLDIIANEMTSFGYYDCRYEDYLASAYLKIDESDRVEQLIKRIQSEMRDSAKDIAEKRAKACERLLEEYRGMRVLQFFD